MNDVERMREKKLVYPPHLPYCVRMLQGRESRAWERRGGGISDCRMKKRISRRDKEVQACEKERCIPGGIGYEAGAFVVHSLGAPPGYE